MNRKAISSIILFLILFSVIGCDSQSNQVRSAENIPASKPSSQSIQESIQKELDDNPEIKQKGLSVKVVNLNSGFLTLNISGLTHERAIRQINGGTELSYIYMCCTMSVGPIMEAEEIIKKRPEIKGISWTAK